MNPNFVELLNSPIEYTDHGNRVQHDFHKYSANFSNSEIKKYYNTFGRLPPTRKELYNSQYL